MRKDLLFCDVNLVAGNVEIPANKMILAAASPYFLAMFSHFKESKERNVTITGIRPETLTLLIDYVYSSKLLITGENVQDLLLASNLLQFEDVGNACIEFLEDQLHPANCLGIEAFADSLGFQDLAKEAKSIIYENFEDVTKSEEFLRLPFGGISRIISWDELKVPTEQEVYESVLTWIRHDFELRQQYFVSLMKSVRICFLPVEYVREILLEEALLKNNPECLDFIADALKCFLPSNPDRSTVKRRQYGNLPKEILSEENSPPAQVAPSRPAAPITPPPQLRRPPSPIRLPSPSRPQPKRARTNGVAARPRARGSPRDLGGPRGAFHGRRCSRRRTVIINIFT